MKVGKKTAVSRSPVGVIIYATNMVPKILNRPVTEVEIEEAVADYEAKRKKQAAEFGELE